MSPAGRGVDGGGDVDEPERQGMWDRKGWSRVSCEHRDILVHGPNPEAACVLSGLTDLHGQYGEALVYTEWGRADESPLLRDYRWPDSDRECEHWIHAPLAAVGVPADQERNEQ